MGDRKGFRAIKRQTLIGQLQKLLDQYSDGQIIKELIQNAEDGGAHKVKILFVNQQHETDTRTWREDPVLFGLKGPALCVYNDGIFSQDDWESIAAIQCSVKENKPLQVGRFGLGFKSVFHITDTPLIVSGNSLMIMNPEADESDVVYNAELTSLDRNCQVALIELMSGIFDFTKEVLEKGHYNGSLFWFPLRQQPSRLSKKVYHESEIRNIFNCFANLAPSYLLFLKEIEEIEISEKNSEGKRKLFLVGLFNKNMEILRKERADFLKQIQTFNGQLAPNPVSKSLVLNVRSEGFYWLKQKKTEDIWLVVNHYHGGQVSQELRTLIDDEDWNYSPYVSLGACITRPISSGHVFCFLPLPEEGQSLTGFPVHVNGYFALSQDRHHVKWHSSEALQSNKNTERSITWNSLLVKEILPIVYSELIMQLVQPSDQMKSTMKTSIPPSLIYGIFPSKTKVTDHWRSLITPLYNRLIDKPCIFTRQNNGKWILPSNAIFLKNENMSDSMFKIIENILLEYDFKVTFADKYITDALYNQNCPITFVTTKHVKGLFVSHKKSKMTREQKLCVLHYMLIENASDLEDLPLLPIADGSFGTFNRTLNEVYFTQQKEDIEMFPLTEDCFVDFNVDQDLLVEMQKLCRAEQFQLRIFYPKHVPDLLNKCIEKNRWKGAVITKQIDQWLVKVWTYIKRNQDLKKSVKDLHLLPEEDSSTAKKYLGKASKISILSNYRGFQVMGKKLQSALKMLNVNIYSSLPGPISSVVAGDLVEFPGIDGVYNCLRKIVDDERLLDAAVCTFNEESKTGEKIEIRNVCTSIRSLSEVTKLIGRLTLFPSWNKGEYFSFQDVKLVYDPREQPKIPITPFQDIIICDDNHTKEIAQMCGAKIISTYELWCNILTNLNDTSCYSKSQRQTFMVFFESTIEKFNGKEKENLLKLAQNVCFVKDKDGNLYTPQRMLDPRSSILKDLFNDDMSPFPAKQDKNYLRFLQMIGLRCEEDITEDELIKSTDAIEKEYERHGPSLDCVKRAKALMTYLNKYGKRLDKNTLTEISTKKCCPVMYKRPTDYPTSMAFKGDDSAQRLEKISSLLPASCAKLVGGNAYIANQNVSVHLEKFEASLSVDKVVSQLHTLVDNYSTDGGKEYDRYMSVLMDIYTFLNNSDHASVADLLRSEVIYTSDGTFRKPINVWLLKRHTDIVLEPYAYRLPEHLWKFKELFHRMGCEYHQTTRILLKTLKAIKEFHENGFIPLRETVQRDSQIVVTIVNTLADSNEDLSNEILLPVVSESDDVLKLKLANECAICSNDWYDDVVLTLDESDPFYIIHKKISQDTALKFKVKHLTDVILENAKHFDLNYGQREPLTTRLANIIKDYTDGFTIPKEIIQNADDSGASTVKFLYDERREQKAQTCLFKDEMLPFQGPAFWAFNDKEFSVKDFKNIIKLAGATKMDDKMKIGRFGLGFNSVYNLTDVPSFLSGDTYVVFDPHEIYLGKCGLKVELNHKRNRFIRQKMKGQFYPFEGIFGCRIVDEETVKFNGTLFRFPLRGPEEAAISKIKQTSYSKKDMIEFLNKIMKSAGSLLLFTQHVKVVELYYLDKNAKEPDLLMKVSKTSNCTGTSIISTLTDSSRRNAEVTEEIEINLEIKHHDLCGQQSSKNQASYIIYWSFGKVAAKLTTTERDLKGLLSVAATAITKQTVKNIAGFYDRSHLFCFLPLPILTDLPFHINAAFAVQSSRRGLIWTNEDDIGSCVEELWNRTILEDAVCKSYITMLTKMVTTLPMNTYYTLWPSTILQMKHDQIISKQVYKIIAEGEELVFPYKNSAVCLKQAVFLDPKIRDNTEVGAIAMNALEYFGIDMGCVVDLPQSIQNGFRCAGYQDKLESRTLFVFQFFKSVVFKTITNSYWSKSDLDKLLLYGLLECGDDLSNMFNTTPCIPTKPYGNRKIASDLIHPYGDLAKLYLEVEECFPDKSFMDHNVLVALVELGMKENEMNWEALPERVNTFIKQPESLVTLINHLINYLLSFSANSRGRRYENCPDHIRNKLFTMHFLPILKKDKKWSMPWKGDEYEENHLIAPRDGYHSKLCNLIGCVKLLVDTSLFSMFESKTILCWWGLKDKSSCIDVDIVLDNMLTMSSHMMEGGGKRAEMSLTLEKSFYDMYEFLMPFIDEDKNSNNQDLIKDSLSARCVILHEKTLKTTDQMVLHLHTNLTPYLFGVESIYRKFEKLFLKIGVHSKLSTSLLVGTLHSIYQDYQTQPLPSDMVDCINTICIEIEKISRDKPGEENKDMYKDVKLPSEDSILTSIEKLYFDDCPWLRKSSDKDLIHLNKKISQQVASHLGVKSKRTHDVDLISSPFCSEFGQREELTNRLRRILEGYPCNESIMKEMLQNADDAGATEVAFITDFRSLPNTRLPFDSLKDAQVPALCIFNNAAFTEKDIEGIQNLGKGSKFDENLKTGKYGVGFNVVYHLTDFPSFWTKSEEVGENVCMFDPNRKYLAVNMERKPGIRMNVEHFEESYPDFMDGYIPKFTKSLKSGTLFRLPLRTASMAQTSELINKATSPTNVKKMLEDLKKDISSNILFLDNIRTVKIGSVDSNGSVIIEHETKIHLNKEDSEKQKEYVKHVKQLSRSLEKLDPILLQNPMEIRIIARIESTQEKHTEYIVVKRAGFLPVGVCTDTLTGVLSNGTTRRLPRGGVALRSSNLKENGIVYCMLPLPVTTGLPVHVNGQFALDHESRHNITCSLNSVDGQWNQLLAKFLIVPAYISALDWYKEQIFSGRQANCTHIELKNAVSQLEAKLPVIDDTNGDFWKNLSKDVYRYIANEKIELFPVFLESANKWSDITWTSVKVKGNDAMLGFFNQLYTYFPEKSEKSSWIYRSAGSFSVETTKIKVKTDKLDKSDKLGQILTELGMRIMRTSGTVLNQFLKSECKVETVSPLNVLEFLKSFKNAHVENRLVLGHLPAVIKDTPFKDPTSFKLVLKFVLKEVKKEDTEQLYESPLLLRQDGYIGVFDDNTSIFVSEYCDLIPEKSSEFVSSEVVSALGKYVDSFKPLKRWGIKSFASMLQSTKRDMCVGNILNWSLSEDEKRWIERVWDFILLHYKKEDGNVDESLLNPLIHISLLPVQSGSNFQLYPLSKRDRVLSITQLRMKEFSDLMIKKGMPILWSFKLKMLVVEIDCPSSVLSLLDKNCTYLSEMSNEEACIIFRYFTRQYEEIRNIDLLRNLPIFETQDGKLTPLNSGTKYVCLMDQLKRVPRDGFEQWSSKSGIIILTYQECSQRLLKQVGVDVVNPTELYINHILIDCSMFNDENMLQHLVYVRDVLFKEISVQNKEMLENRLQNLPFLPRTNGNRVLASNFYDSSHQVFDCMKDHLEFPPAPFDAPKWRNLLLAAGLICDISVKLFEFLANTVSHLTVNDKTLEKSNVLLCYWFRAGRKFQKDSSCCIKKIKFVERIVLGGNSVNIQICDQFTDRKLIAFKGSYINSLTDYTWTVANTLRCTLDPNQIEDLDVKSDVEPDVFIHNFKNVCHALEDETKFKHLEMAKVTSMFESFYDYMQKNKNRIDFSSLSEFATIMVPDEKKLVKSYKVFLDPERDQTISHRIYKAPVAFHKYFDVFKELGVGETPTPSIYTEVLMDIHDHCGGQPLEPNESKIVSTCLLQLVKLWKSKPAVNDDPSIPLYLPNHDGVMKKSSTLVFVDNLYLKDLLKSMELTYFIGYTELQVKIDDPLSQHECWPKQYQMKLLSSLIVKKIDVTCLKTAKINNLALDTMDTLNHADFHNSIIRLARHVQEESGRSLLDEEEANAKIKQICKIKCMGVETLMVECFHNNVKIDQSKKREKVFVDRNGEIMLYLDSSLGPDDQVYLVCMLGQLINEILNVKISDYFNVIWSLAKTKIGEISYFLDGNGIRASEFKSKINNSLFPLPGTPIPENMHFLLDNSFCNFENDEYVGLEIFDPCVLSEENQIRSDESDESDDSEFLEFQNQLNESAMYIYAIIVEKVSEGGVDSFATYKLNVGVSEFIEMDSTRIYKIMRPKKMSSTELVPFEDNEFGQAQVSAKVNLDVSSILKEIRKILTKAFKLPSESERRRVIKRLLLRWHPDKNRENIETSTHITQMIHHYICCLEKGLPLEECYEEQTNDTTDGPPSRKSPYSGLFQNMRFRGSKYARQSNNASYTFNFHSFSKPYARHTSDPRPGEAARWLKQAKYDLKEAELSLERNSNSHNWICYKCQQAAEKSLKAIWYSKDAYQVNHSHNLADISAGLSDEIRELACDLQRRIGDHMRMRYPDTLQYPKIPFEMYDISHSSEACRLTREIIRLSTRAICG